LINSKNIKNQKQLQLFRIFFLFHRSAFSIFGIVYASRLINEFGFNNQQLMSLELIFCISSLVFEIPTGIMADKLGHKNSVVLGSFCWFASTLICIQGNTYNMLVVSELVAALAYAFISGALDAWLGARFTNDTDYSEYKRRNNHECRILMLILTVSSGYITQYWGYSIPYYIATGMFLIAFGLSFWLEKVKVCKLKKEVKVKDSIKYYFSEPKLISLAFLGMTSTLWLSPVMMLWAPLFTKDLGYSQSWLGIIAGMLSIGAVIGGYLELKFKKQLSTNSMKTEIILQVLTGLSIIILSLNLKHNIVIIISLFLVFEVITHANQQFSNLHSNTFWRGRKDEATVASIHSLIIRVGGTTGSLVMGTCADMFGRAETWTISGVMMVITTIIIVILSTSCNQSMQN
jgi:predicted MFS family arabinose efflux permease